MPKIKAIEERIWAIEQLNVIIRHSDGKDMRSDKKGIPHYRRYKKKSADSMSVADWYRLRFKNFYPGFSVDVVNARKEIVPKHTKLETLRDSYRKAGQLW